MTMILMWTLYPFLRLLLSSGGDEATGPWPEL